MTLREARKAKGLTIQQLSYFSGVSYNQIQTLETGGREIANIHVKNFMALCKVLEVDPWEIYGWEY